MENCIKLTLFLLTISEFKSQIIISNIKGPSVIQNLSSVNKQGSVLTIINGHVVNPSIATEDNDYVIKGPLVIHGTGSAVTTIQSQQSAGGNVLSVISTNVNNSDQVNDDPRKGEHQTTHSQIRPTTAALNQGGYFEQNSDEVQAGHNKNPGNPPITRPVIDVDEDSSKIYLFLNKK